MAGPFWAGVASLVDLKANPLLAERVTASADLELSRRIDLGRQAVLAQTPLFIAQFGRASSHWKHDGTRVTDADLAISETLTATLRSAFATDDSFSEELAVGRRANSVPERVDLGARSNRWDQ